MRCEQYREAHSARLDDEGTGLESTALDHHLGACPACRAWVDAATHLTVAARLAGQGPTPDLTATITGHRVAARGAGRRPAAPKRSAAGVARLGLALVALAQLAIAVPALRGADAGAPVHIAREQGAWALALGVGFLVAVLRPGRAAGMLPLVGALVACLTVVASLDILDGRTVAAAEAPHGLALLGLVTLWLLAHPTMGQRLPARGTNQPRPA